MANPASTAPVLLCGSQYTVLSAQQLSNLRDVLHSNGDLKFLAEALAQLHACWPAVQDAYAPLRRSTDAAQLEKLREYIDTDDVEAIDTKVRPNNVLLAPLTVAMQLAQLVASGDVPGLQDNFATFPASAYLKDVQGFCIGFLTAIVVACARDQSGFERMAVRALRLAVCIGAVVDLEEEEALSESESDYTAYAVRWTGASQKADVEKVLESLPLAYISCFLDENSVTITLSADDVASFRRKIASTQASAVAVNLLGKYHHESNVEAVRSLKALCHSDESFQLPNASDLSLPLRSSLDALWIRAGRLHDIALDSILLQPAQWYRIVRECTTATHDAAGILTLGASSCVPRSIAAGFKVTPLSCGGVRGSKSKLSIDEVTLDKSNDSAGDGAAEEEFLLLNGGHPVDPDPTTDRIGLVPGTKRSVAAPIAIIGMACRFPEADTLDEFWTLLSEGRCAVKPLSDSRFQIEEQLRKPKGPFFGNFLRDHDSFDHRFFNISGREAKSMDPQQRLLLQVTYEALESSGYFGRNKKAVQSPDVGCHFGVGSVDYEDNVASEDANAFSATGTLRAFISGKLSHHFGWSGPSVTYDTACSSSAVAIHSACQALRLGECSMAVAGGVNVMTSPRLFQNLGAANFLSPIGGSKAFDAAADGYCRGEGAGVVLLKPLSQALANGNNVLAVIAGSAVNQGSNCSPITVPHSGSQSSLYRRALAAAGIEPTQVTYVEAHGTGTQVGDPIECESIRETFGDSTRSADISLGSVKDNIGHLEGASGVAALIKTVLMMQNNSISKQAAFKSLNPKIPPLERDKLAIPTQSRTWCGNKHALVTNYGAAGSNAALVVCEHPQQSDLGVDVHSPSLANGVESRKPTNETESDSGRKWPVFISAHKAESLISYCRVLSSILMRLPNECSLRDVAFSLAMQQNVDLEYSWTSTVTNKNELDEQLQSVLRDNSKMAHRDKSLPAIVLCFAGQNGKTFSISEDLFHSCPILRSRLVECNSVLLTMRLPSLFPGLFSEASVEDVIVLHCRMFCIQYACAMAWIDCGLKVDTVLGHSFGQLTALCVAGVLSLGDSIRFVSGRARLIRQHWSSDSGTMLSVESDLAGVQELLASLKEKSSAFSASIACYNGPKHFVIAGSVDDIEAFEQGIEVVSSRPPIRSKRLNNTHAFHSQLFDPILPGLRDITSTLVFHEPSLRIETCSKGASWSNYNSEMLVQHTRAPVYFSEAVERVSARNVTTTWVDAGCGPSVIQLIRRIQDTSAASSDTFHSLSLANANSQAVLAKTCSTLWSAGYSVQFWPFEGYENSSHTWLRLPPYQFEKTRHWIDYKAPQRAIVGPTTLRADSSRDLLTKVERQQSPECQSLFSVNVKHEVFASCTKGHAVLEQCLCPASMYVELSVQGAMKINQSFDSSKGAEVHDLVMTSPLSLNYPREVFLEVNAEGDQGYTSKFRLYSLCSGDENGSEELHATGTISLYEKNDWKLLSRLNTLERLVGSSRCQQLLASSSANGLQGSMVYRTFSRVVNYAAYYQGVTSVMAEGFEVVGRVTTPVQTLESLDSCTTNPIALDNFLQVAGLHVNCLSDCKATDVFLCTSIGEMVLGPQYGKAKAPWIVFSSFNKTSESLVSNDIVVFDSISNEAVLAILGACFKKVPLTSLARSLARLNDTQDFAPRIPVQRVDPQTPDSDATAVPSPAALELVDSLAHPLQGSVDTSPSGDNTWLDKLRVLLGEVAEIPLKDIKAESTFDDLGIDSLLITEAIGEMQKRLSVEVSADQLQALGSLRAIASHLGPKTGPDTKFSKVEEIIQVSVTGPSNSAEKTQQDPELENFAEIACKSFQKSLSYDDAAKETGFASFCSEVYPFQSELVTAYTVEAFADLGCNLDMITKGQEIPRPRINVEHAKLEHQLYRILEDAALVAVDVNGSGRYIRTSGSVPSMSAAALSQKSFTDSLDTHRNICCWMPLAPSLQSA